MNKHLAVSLLLLAVLFQPVLLLADDAVPGALPADGVWPVEDTVRAVDLDAEAQNATEAEQDPNAAGTEQAQDAAAQQAKKTPPPAGSTPPPPPDHPGTTADAQQNAEPEPSQGGSWQDMLRAIQSESVQQEAETVTTTSEPESPQVQEAFSYDPDAEAKAKEAEDAARQAEIDQSIKEIEEGQNAQVQSFEEQVTVDDGAPKLGAEEWLPPQSKTSSIQGTSSIKNSSGIKGTSGIQSKSGIQ